MIRGCPTSNGGDVLPRVSLHVRQGYSETYQLPHSLKGTLGTLTCLDPGCEVPVQRWWWVVMGANRPAGVSESPCPTPSPTQKERPACRNHRERGVHDPLPSLHDLRHPCPVHADMSQQIGWQSAPLLAAALPRGTAEDYTPHPSSYDLRVCRCFET